MIVAGSLDQKLPCYNLGGCVECTVVSLVYGSGDTKYEWRLVGLSELPKVTQAAQRLRGGPKWFISVYLHRTVYIRLCVRAMLGNLDERV